MANIGYALDELGTNPDNKYTERRVLTAKAVDGRSFMIPKVTPFFGDDDKLKITSGNRLLVRDTDYQLILLSPEISERLGRDIYGGILFHDLETAQVVDVELQTVGGDFNLPLNHTAENLARIISNPVFTTFSQIVGTPVGLPTFTHTQNWDSIAGFDDLIKQMELIHLTLIGRGQGTGGDSNAVLAALLSHINGTNAHTKAQVGLSEVQNYPMAQFNDFNGTTYPNNRYVSPRHVMYAIELFIGNKIGEVDKQIEDLVKLTEESQQDWTTLQQRWSDLQTTIQQINISYTQMVQTVRGYQTAVENMDQNYRQLVENQAQYHQTLSAMNQTVQGYRNDYNAVIESRDALVSKMEQMETAYNNFAETNSNLIETVATNESTVKALTKFVMHPDLKTITGGSYHFKIKPNEKFRIVLIGGGGGVGNSVTETPNHGASYGGEHGGNTTLWALQNLTNGEFMPAAKPIAEAEGGFGGGATYISNDVVTAYGNGGRGGSYYIMEQLLSAVLEASKGDGGTKGFGPHTNQTLSLQQTGYEYFGEYFGRGAKTVDSIGQGGEGAKLDIEYTNNTNFELEFMVVVGGRGRSYTSPASSNNNATGGLAIITKL